MRLGTLVAALCLACGGGGDDDGAGDRDGGGGQDDGGAADGAADGDGGRDPDAVVVRVFGEDVGPEGLLVVLQDADGAVLEEGLTDADSEVVFVDPPAGALVTVLLEAEGTPQRSAYTVVGVEAGDVIVVGEPPFVAEETMNVRVDYPGGFTGAETYLTDMGCDAWGQGDPDVLLDRSIGVSCLAADGHLDGLAQAREGTTPLAYAVVRDVAPVAGTTDIPLGAWMPATTLELTVGNLTAEIDDTDVDLRAELAGASRWPGPQAGDVFTVPAASQVDGWLVSAAARAFDGGDARVWQRRMVLPADIASPHELDFDTFGPRFDTLAIDAADPLRPEVTWTSSAATDSYNVIMLRVTWYDPEQLPDGGHLWTVVMPADTTSVVLPALPSSAASDRPSATAEYSMLQVYALWYARHDDYAAARNDRPFELNGAFVDGTTDEARFQYFQEDLEP